MSRGGKMGVPLDKCVILDCILESLFHNHVALLTGVSVMTMRYEGTVLNDPATEECQLQVHQMN